MYTFACKDIGMDCGFTAKDKNKDNLMKKIAKHAKEVHKIDPIPPDLAQKVQNAIKEA